MTGLHLSSVDLSLLFLLVPDGGEEFPGRGLLMVPQGMFPLKHFQLAQVFLGDVRPNALHRETGLEKQDPKRDALRMGQAQVKAPIEDVSFPREEIDWDILQSRASDRQELLKANQVGNEVGSRRDAIERRGTARGLTEVGQCAS